MISRAFLIMSYINCQVCILWITQSTLEQVKDSKTNQLLGVELSRSKIKLHLTPCLQHGVASREFTTIQNLLKIWSSKVWVEVHNNTKSISLHQCKLRWKFYNNNLKHDRILRKTSIYSKIRYWKQNLRQKKFYHFSKNNFKVSRITKSVAYRHLLKR